MKKGIENPSEFVPYSRVINAAADFFLNLVSNPASENLGNVKRVSGYKTIFYDVTISGTTYDVMAHCKIQTPDGQVLDEYEDVSWVPNNLTSCWKNRKLARERLQELIISKYK